MTRSKLASFALSSAFLTLSACAAEVSTEEAERVLGGKADGEAPAAGCFEMPEGAEAIRVEDYLRDNDGATGGFYGSVFKAECPNRDDLCSFRSKIVDPNARAIRTITELPQADGSSLFVYDKAEINHGSYRALRVPQGASCRAGATGTTSGSR